MHESVSLYLQLRRDTVVRLLLDWFVREARTFPWRSQECNRRRWINDPYVVMVSEVMLQQTQARRVAERLPAFLRRFPNVERLAAASTGELLRAWSGLGYNRRALNLQRTAAVIVDEYGGVFPEDREGLERLPGIGTYTASAIRCFAFGHDVAVVDVNVARVVSRVFYRCHSAAAVMPERVVEAAAEHIVPAGDAYRWHSALMDLGSTICTRRAPRCGQCPLLEVCLSADPPELELFNARSLRRAEPSIADVPRRIWRGRIVELLRGHRQGMPAAAIIDTVLPSAKLTQRRDLLDAMNGLLNEGLLVRPGAVREGSLQEVDVLALPE